MNQLPDVLLQMILQLCDLPSLLRLARVSHRMLRVADAPFVLQHARLHVTPRLVSRANQLPLSSCRLLRHAPVCLTLVDSAECVALSAVLDRVGSVSELRDDRSEMSADRWLGPPDLLIHTALRSVRVLHLGQSSRAPVQITAQLMSALTTLPLMHTLTLNPASDHAIAYRGLPLLPALTDLRTQGYADARTECDAFVCVADCPQLVSLSLVAPPLTAPSFHSFFTSPRLASQLRSLTLSRFNPTPVPGLESDDGRSALLAAAFRALRSLTQLCLNNAPRCDSLLAHVSAAPSLLSVRVIAGANTVRSLVDEGRIPSASALSALLSAPPARLRVAVTLVWLEVIFDEPPPNDDTRLLDDITAQCADDDSLAQFSDRCSVASKVQTTND